MHRSGWANNPKRMGWSKKDRGGGEKKEENEAAAGRICAHQGGYLVFHIGAALVH